MNPEQKNPEEKLISLCDRAVTGKASVDELAELERLLESDRSAQQVYLDWAAMHVDLASLISARRPRQAIVELAQNRVAFWTPPRAAWFAALAATLLIAVFLGSWYRSDAPNLAVAEKDLQAEVLQNFRVASHPEIDGMAVLSRVEDVDWKREAAEQFAIGDLLRSNDWIEIESGTVEVEFGQGAVVVLQGPARFSAKTTSKGILDYGKLAAVVPPWADGFRIDTPAFEVVDRGTQFVVEVSPEQVNVGVTKGEVEISHREQPNASEKIEFKHSLLAGKAIRAWSGNLLETSLDNRWSALSEKLPSRPSHSDVEVVARYRSDFFPGIRNKPRSKGNWRYYANQWGPLENTDGYVELLWDNTRKVFDPNGNKKRNAGSRLNAANLSYRGGHPGQGRDQTKDDTDHYVIAAYQIPEQGRYRLESGWLVRAESRDDNDYQAVDLRVRVNDQSDVIHETCNRDGLLRFQGDLGHLKKGDWVYVAVGPQGVSFNDRFEWDFAIVKTVTPIDAI